MIRSTRLTALAATAIALGTVATGCGGSDTVTVEGEVDDTTTVLFLRGADGTGGSLVQDAKEIHLSNIDDEEHTTGFGQLAALLRADGMEVEQVIEGTPEADLAGGALDGVDVLVLGSNNAPYEQAQVDAVEDFVRSGGGLLAFSDANYSTEDAAEAPDSDTTLLAPFDLMANQDDGEQAVAERDDSWPDHPVLEGVDSIEWFGADTITVTDAGPEVLVPFTGEVVEDAAADRRRAATDQDAVVAVVEYGAGRVAAVLDRDIFFNEGGTVSLASGSNEQFATNLFEWLAGQR